MKYQNVILGGGLSGLIAGYYLPDSIILEKTSLAGGAMKTHIILDRYDEDNRASAKFHTGLKYLHATDSVNNLFKSLILHADRRKIIGKIFYNNLLSDFGKHTPKILIKEYFEKTRRQKLTADIDLSEIKVMNSTLDEKEHDGITNISELIERLKKKVKIAYDCDVGFVDFASKTVFLRNGYEFQYDNLISTIPLPALGQLNFKDFNMASTYSHVICFKVRDFVTPKYDYIYFPEAKYRFHRVSFYGDVVCVEISALAKDDYSSEVKKILNDLKIVDETKIAITAPHISEYGHFKYDYKSKEKLNSIKEWLSAHDVYTVGRYANWDHSEKIDKTIENIIKIAEEIKNE